MENLANYANYVMMAYVICGSILLGFGLVVIAKFLIVKKISHEKKL